MSPRSSAGSRSQGGVGEKCAASALSVTTRRRGEDLSFGQRRWIGRSAEAAAVSSPINALRRISGAAGQSGCRVTPVA
ncbi:hypothetical protein MQ089_18765 [Edwardsiella anguillarum]|uniref:hypothetical protein n=1 Tax=Edwardsiella anguillarum TaxID=1821960 RepID=UPI0024B63E3D|nr:hypothetical protein [Edwardsiella anguillarum]WHQ17289.1 hypothetical protein MQ085_15670 [Edwardsiella anguillarum]WHQ24347.1 hypothetical protein MQ094_15680 [Edwardsiella anguillarum]WHQ27917.1 hypothetical protein MQ093_15895 [Edwardsiella anguillarum]